MRFQSPAFRAFDFFKLVDFGALSISRTPDSLGEQGLKVGILPFGFSSSCRHGYSAEGRRRKNVAGNDKPTGRKSRVRATNRFRFQAAASDCSNRRANAAAT